MFARRFISLVMTALVLACPFCDCGECCGMCSPAECVLPDGCDEAVEKVCGCGCGEEAQLPCDHDDSDNSKHFDCFCNGAVLSDATDCPDHDSHDGLVAVVVMDGLRQFTGTQNFHPSFTHRSHFPPLLSGRDICTLLGSHLL